MKMSNSTKIGTWFEFIFILGLNHMKNLAEPTRAFLTAILAPLEKRSGYMCKMNTLC